MDRLYFTTEEVSEAILAAGIELRPEDCLVTKYSVIADKLGELGRQRVRASLDGFVRKVLR